jgi:bifunctional UDP-N-acetylglucosamine pyrophosphorylase/glucosamine-1-phosphate N-acetyltransferase
MALDIVILAAGKGTRMKSALPKVLHRLAGRPLLLHVLDACATLHAQRTVIVTGYAAPDVEQCIGSRDVRRCLTKTAPR